MRLKYEFEMMNLDDQLVAVPIGEGAEAFHGVIKLNTTAAVIFEMLKSDTSAEAIAEELSRRYNVSSDAAKTDVLSYLDQFQKRDLLA